MSLVFLYLALADSPSAIDCKIFRIEPILRIEQLLILDGSLGERLDGIIEMGKRERINFPFDAVLADSSQPVIDELVQYSFFLIEPNHLLIKLCLVRIVADLVSTSHPPELLFNELLCFAFIFVDVRKDPCFAYIVSLVGLYFLVQLCKLSSHKVLEALKVLIKITNVLVDAGDQSKTIEVGFFCKITSEAQRIIECTVRFGKNLHFFACLSNNFV